jgi:hypothetical protein
VDAELSVAAVKTRVIEVGAKDAARQVVADQAAGHSAVEPESGQVRLDEGRDRHA